MILSELKPGDKIYDVENKRVRSYSFLCIHPNNKEYFIIIDENKDPFKIYSGRLQTILNKSLPSYRDAQMLLAKELQEYVSKLLEKQPV